MMFNGFYIENSSRKKYVHHMTIYAMAGKITFIIEEKYTC